jgi:uncharacterized membrane protein (DUF4010 family)
MDPAAQVLFKNLGIAVLLGLLVGLQRERRNQQLGGLRTFPLITVLGTLAATIDANHRAGGWIIAAMGLAVAAAVVASHVMQVRGPMADYGTTTVMAILLMYAVGAYLPGGQPLVAIAVGGGVAVLLEFKPELHGVAGQLGDTDLRAIFKFVLITCIVLPVLPNRTYGGPPWDVLNPFEIWLMVVLIVGISLGGYLIYKFFGRQAGIVLGGVLGGLISSTATTVTVARRTQAAASGTHTATVVVLIAAAVVYGRVLLEIGVVAPGLFVQMAPPLTVPMAACLAAAWITCRRVWSEPDPLVEQKNPAELKSAMVFAAIYAVVLLALAATKLWFGGKGLYVVAILSGLTDMDAITLSTARMAHVGGETALLPREAWRLIIVASMANLVFKAAVATALGSREFGRSVRHAFALPFLAAAAAWAFFPL